MKATKFLLFNSLLSLMQIRMTNANTEESAKVKLVKVAVVIQDLIVDGKRIHETFRTPLRDGAEL